jgi:hypothetical protein
MFELPTCAAGAPPAILQAPLSSQEEALQAWKTSTMRCRGCASKVAPRNLAEVLSTLPEDVTPLQQKEIKPTSISSNGVEHQALLDPSAGSGSTEQRSPSGTSDPIGLRDDAALLPRVPPSHLAVQSVDFISACVDDPFLFGRIAAVHAMSDCFAMGAEPVAALATVQVVLSLLFSCCLTGLGTIFLTAQNLVLLGLPCAAQDLELRWVPLADQSLE